MGREAPWRQKAKREIARMCRAEWEAANRLPNGRLRRRHRPYGVPPVAEALLETLNSNDERAAKAIMLDIGYLEQITIVEVKGAARSR